MVGFERGNVLSLDFGGGFDEIAYRSTKFLIGSPVSDMIEPRSKPALSDRLHWCGLQGLG